MMSALIFAVAVACALAAPTEDRDAQIEENTFDLRPDGYFHSSFITSNGIKTQESGSVKQGVDEKNNPVQFLVKQGKYLWQDPEGQEHSISWTADENGYQAEGADVPKAS